MNNSKLYLSSPHIGDQELKFVREAFATNWVAPLGPHVDGFEREFCGVVGSRHAAALSSGTAALHLALKLVGVKPGDEVFCSTLTFSASANPIDYEGGKPVFLDSERQSWNLDPALLAEALADRAMKGRLPRALVLVHRYGQCADLTPIAALCEQYSVALIEDAAEALGAVYFPTQPDQQELTEKTEKATGPTRTSVTSFASCSKLGIAPGTVGRLGIFSFNGNNIITTSGGGATLRGQPVTC